MAVEFTRTHPGEAAEERAAWGLVAPLPAADPRYAFLAGDAPDTVHPALWRLARLNAEGGLFQVAANVYQVRGLDLAGVTFVRGDSGWIAVDPLGAAETARAAHGLVREHVDDLPVTAIVYTRPHLDHFGGAGGLATAGAAPVVAPEGFVAAVTAEGVLTGRNMGLRAVSMFGLMLPPGPRGHVDSGLGKQAALGHTALLPPTVEVPTAGAELTLDGVRFVFRVVPPSEARAEMNFFLPELGALCLAESCLATLHNVYAPRADALAWSKELGAALELFGPDASVVFGSHHWPRWGSAAVRDHLARQRDVYRHLHDQTLRLAGRGLGPEAIAAAIDLPEGLRDSFAMHGRRGRIAHTVRAAYLGNLGWYDLDPDHLDPLPRAETASRELAYMGGADAVLERAGRDFDRGEYRWVADVAGRVLAAEPASERARLLRADALEQLGFQAESAAWRNCYLTAALGLRGAIPAGPPPDGGGPDLLAGMGAEQVFDALGVRLDPARATPDLTVSWRLGDGAGDWVLGVANATIHAIPGRVEPDGDAVVTTSLPGLRALVADPSGLDRLLAAGDLAVAGRVDALRQLFAMLDE